MTPPKDSSFQKEAGLKTLMQRGDHYVWLTGATLALSLIMVSGLLVLVTSRGIGFFWPHTLTQVETTEGNVLGWKTETESFRRSQSDAAQTIKVGMRSQFKVANRDIGGSDFRWLEHDIIKKWDQPANAISMERWEYGDFYGYLKEFRQEGKKLADGDAAWAMLQEKIPVIRKQHNQIVKIETDDIGNVSTKIEDIRIKLKGLNAEKDGVQIAQLKTKSDALQAEYEKLKTSVDTSRLDNQRYTVVMAAADGTEKEINLDVIVRAFMPNSMSLPGKVGHYFMKVWEFVSEEPRESNTEGGIFPAIFGTVLMTVMLALAVAPFGVIAAFYLREYAKQGFLVRCVRIAVNNLAGVPSIVFGVFGLGFFIYTVGGSIDNLLYADRLPTPTFGTGGIMWASFTLALLTVPVVIVATEESIAAVPRGAREGSLALGATKFQTVWEIVLPASVPGILTGLILAMARGAGEVAPLMITGVVKLAPALPLDGTAPFAHFERKFMHLGFHIYDVGFQSPNIEAAKPMVYTTTLLLLAVVVILNIVAIRLRDRIRKKYQTGAFA